jgi:hypothetical protein
MAVVYTSALASVKSADRSAISKGYQWAAATMNKKNATGLAKGMTDYFKYTEKGQTSNRADTLQKMQTQMGMMKTFHAGFRPTKFTQKGADIVVNCNYSFSGTMADPKTKKVHRMADSGTCVDTWANVGGHWMMKAIDIKTDHMTMDGKAMKSG